MVGAVFVSEGIQKFLFPIEIGAGRFAKIGFPSPAFVASFVGCLDQHAAGGDFGLVFHQSTAVAVVMVNHAIGKVAVGFVVYANAEDRRVKHSGTMQIGDGDIEPNAWLYLLLIAAQFVNRSVRSCLSCRK